MPKQDTPTPDSSCAAAGDLLIHRACSQLRPSGCLLPRHGGCCGERVAGEWTIRNSALLSSSSRQPEKVPSSRLNEQTVCTENSETCRISPRRIRATNPSGLICRIACGRTPQFLNASEDEGAHSAKRPPGINHTPTEDAINGGAVRDCRDPEIGAGPHSR